jgi:hypothetical protein
MPRGFLRNFSSLRGGCSTMDSTAVQRSVPAGAPLTYPRSIHRTWNDESLARTTLVTSTVTEFCPIRENGSLVRA